MAEETMDTEETTVDKTAQGFSAFAQKFVGSDPRMQALQAKEDPTDVDNLNMRVTAQEIESEIRQKQDDFKRLNPGATEVQVEEYTTAVFERDMVKLDEIQKEIERQRQEKETAEANEKKKSVALNTEDTAQDGGGENRFTGENTRSGIRKILFGNS